MVCRPGSGNSAGLWESDYEWSRCVAPLFFCTNVQIERPCPDRDYDPKLFENASLVNYGAWLYTAFALPLIYLLNSGTPILERGHGGRVDPRC